MSSEKYIRVLRESVLSVTEARSLIVIRTVPGMAMAAAAALDSWENKAIAGCIAGDDTIFCAVYPDTDTAGLIRTIRSFLN